MRFGDYVSDKLRRGQGQACQEEGQGRIHGGRWHVRRWQSVGLEQRASRQPVLYILTDGHLQEIQCCLRRFAR